MSCCRGGMRPQRIYTIAQQAYAAAPAHITVENPALSERIAASTAAITDAQPFTAHAHGTQLGD